VERNISNVLVVDDVDSGRFVKAQTLRRAGFTVHEAATGQEALDVGAATPIDLVVLDVNLPDINGLEVGRRLRSLLPGPPALQILHVSNTAIEDSDRVRGLNAGADAYLPEPLDGSVLVATVDALLRIRRAEASLAEALTREQQARAEAEKANNLKDEFIATLSHELRTPLNAVMGWIWQLRQSTLTESAHTRALESLERNTRVQAQLINDLLDVSRITKGKLQLQIRLVDMAKIVEASCESARGAVDRKGDRLQIATETMTVAGDEGRLQQIVGNLLNNAVQFTPEGGSVEITVAREGSEAVLRIRDSGAGIEPSLLPYVFEPFRQGKDGLSRAHGGLGLGLAVVQQLVELHDGSVAVASEGVNRGTTFTVRLPESQLALESSSEPRLLLEGLSVAVAADAAETRESLVAILESSGARVETVSRSISDREATGQPPIDVVVSERDGAVSIAPAQAGDQRGGVQNDRRLARPLRAATLVRTVAEIGDRAASRRSPA
jgi:signal transduction histidine kinase